MEGRLRDIDQLQGKVQQDISLTIQEKISEYKDEIFEKNASTKKKLVELAEILLDKER